MEVSVVIPAYNCEAFLERAVISALEQPQVTEVILVEDGSSDGTLSVCDELLNRFQSVRLYRHPNGTNRGASATRNIGIQSAQAPFVAFLDADDQYLEGRFDEDERIFKAHGDADGVYGATLARFVDETARARYYDRFHTELTTVWKRIAPEDLFQELSGWSKGVGGFHLNALTVRRTSLLRMDPLFREDLPLHQDTDLILRLAATSRLYPGSLDQPVAIRWVHGANRILNIADVEGSRMTLYDRLFKWSKEAHVAAHLQRWFRANYFVARIRSMPTIWGWFFALYVAALHPLLLRWEPLRAEVIRKLGGSRSYWTKGMLAFTWRLDQTGHRP